MILLKFVIILRFELIVVFFFVKVSIMLREEFEYDNVIDVFYIDS